MQSGEVLFIITTMDGIPVLKNDGSIMQFTDTKSCRDNTKNLTFKNKIRYHSWGLSKKDFILAQKQFLLQGYISLKSLSGK